MPNFVFETLLETYGTLMPEKILKEAQDEIAKGNLKPGTLEEFLAL